MGLTLMLLTPKMVFPDSQLVVNSLLSAYRSYFAVVDAGADKHRLPYDVRQKLAPFYGLQLLEQVWYGESNFLQIADAAMTDCHSIYFPSGSGMTDIIEKGNLFNSRHRDDLKWLLHELAHCEQCSQKGGRDSYAQTWFREVALSTITQLFLDPGQVSARMLHDAMPMEKDAEQKAVRVLKQLTSAR
ncbi:MAG: hypothetical protein P8Y38_06770 [Deltaproteobacteria bacterium]